jgi:hypothetical protein
VDFHQPLDVVRQGRLKLDALAGHGVVEGEAPCMERLAGEVAAGVLVPGVREVAPLAPCVEWVSDQGVPDVRHVDADLVGPAGDRAALDERGAGELLDDPVESAGLPSGGDHGHPFALGGVAAYGALDHPFEIDRYAVADGEVSFLDLPLPEGDRQLEVGALGLGHDHESGGVLIQAVHDPRALGAADPGQVVAVLEQRVDQGA